MTKILVVEDEPALRDPLAYRLQRDGFDVVAVADGPAALDAHARGGVDLVLLDLMLPGLSGLEVCRQARRRGDVPIIMLTAKDSETDKVVGLELGADDYVTKPYPTASLLARVHAVLRRGAADPAPEAPVLAVGPVRMDVERHEVTVAGQPVAVPLREFEPARASSSATPTGS